MKPKELKDLVEVLQEYASSHKKTAQITQDSVGELTRELRYTRKLWRKGDNPTLIKIGLALIAFPDPTITDVIGSALVAAGLLQLKLRNSTLYVEDVYKTFPRVVKELGAIKQCI